MIEVLKKVPSRYKKILLVSVSVSLIANLAFGIFILTGVFAFYGLSGQQGEMFKILVDKLPGLVLNGFGYGLIIAVPIILVMFLTDSFKKQK